MLGFDSNGTVPADYQFEHPNFFEPDKGYNLKSKPNSQFMDLYELRMVDGFNKVTEFNLTNITILVSNSISKPLENTFILFSNSQLCSIFLRQNNVQFMTLPTWDH